MLVYCYEWFSFFVNLYRRKYSLYIDLLSETNTKVVIKLYYSNYYEMKKWIALWVVAVACLLIVGCGKKANDWNPTIQNMPNRQQWANVDNAWSDSKTISNPWSVDAWIVTLAQCLKEKDYTMYGTSRCGHCKSQKALFGDAFNYINYVDCDAQKNTCLSEWIKGFPTWKDAQGNAYPWTQQLSVLASNSWCEYSQ